MSEPLGTRYQRRWRLRSVPLQQVVQDLLDFGLPMGPDLTCAYCGVGLSVLREDGHAAACVWRRLAARMALETGDEVRGDA